MINLYFEVFSVFTCLLHCVLYHMISNIVWNACLAAKTDANKFSTHTFPSSLIRFYKIVYTVAFLSCVLSVAQTMYLSSSRCQTGFLVSHSSDSCLLFHLHIQRVVDMYIVTICSRCSGENSRCRHPFVTIMSHYL